MTALNSSPSSCSSSFSREKTCSRTTTISIWRGGAFVSILLTAFSSLAQSTNTLSDAEIQGYQLAQQLCEARPAGNLTNTGVLQIRDGKGRTTRISIRFETAVTATNWSSLYELSPSGAGTNLPVPIKLAVVHDDASSNRYRLTFSFGGDPERRYTKDRSDVVVQFPFAGDFGVADLGLEFFHWPAQKILPNPTELKRGREYKLLESTNPDLSSTNPISPIYYSRVRSWIDQETGGILEAEAYDAQGKLLKVFEPKSFKKVNGQWELQEMEIRNVQTGSRTRVEFDVKKD
jgi:hypothetical protein